MTNAIYRDNHHIQMYLVFRSETPYIEIYTGGEGVAPISVCDWRRIQYTIRLYIYRLNCGKWHKAHYYHHHTKDGRHRNVITRLVNDQLGYVRRWRRQTLEIPIKCKPKIALRSQIILTE